MRKFVSIALFFTLVLSVVTGIVLYIMPHGRVAYWTGWRLFGLGKDQWEALHIVFAFGMAFSGLYHLYLNWKLFKRYLPSKAFFAVALGTLTLFILAVRNLPPVSFVTDLEETIKRSWEKDFSQPPFPHAELLTLHQISERFGFPLEELMARAKERGIKKVSPNITLKDLAKKLGTTPADAFYLIVGRQQKSLIESQKISPRQSRKSTSSSSSLSYPGRRTLKEVCDYFGFSPESCLAVLQKHGIRADLNMRLKDIVRPQGKLPVEIVQWLSAEAGK